MDCGWVRTPHSWAGEGENASPLNLNLGDGGRGPKLNLIASHVHQLKLCSCYSQPRPICLSHSPHLETRGGGGWGDLGPGLRTSGLPQPPGEAGKGSPGSASPAGLLASLGMEVDTGACESSPADGALFGSLSPQTRGRPEERALS